MTNTEITFAEGLKILQASEELRRELANQYFEFENDYFSDLLNCFRRGNIDYSFDLCSRSYFSFKWCAEDWEILEDADDLCRQYGGSAKMEKLVKHAQNLCGSNLRPYIIRKLAGEVKRFFIDQWKAIEEEFYNVYNADEKKSWYLENDFDCYKDWLFNGVEINEDGTITKTTVRKIGQL